VTSILWIFREIHKQASEEVANEPDSIAQQLRNLYMQLETGAIAEEEFDAQEQKLLDRLDKIEARSGADSEEEETPSEEEFEGAPEHATDE